MPELIYTKAKVDELIAAAQSAVAANSNAIDPAALRQIDSFAGATDQAKFDAAMSYAGAATNRVTLQFPARRFGTLSGTRPVFSGLRLRGPFGNYGTKNLEFLNGAYVNHKVDIYCGSGASSFFVNNGTTYDVNMQEIAFQSGGNTSQFMHSAADTNMYACAFDSLTFYGFKHAFGNPTAKFLMTQVVFSGHWTTLGFQDTQYTLGGSDNSLWMGGMLNMNSPTAGDLPAGFGGKPMIIFDGLGKTAVGYLYLTAENDSIGLQVKGNRDKSVGIFNGSFEGRNSGVPATRPVIDVQGGHLVLYTPWTAHVRNNTGNAPGVVRQTGGHLTAYSPAYERSLLEAETLPWLYQTAGTARVLYPWNEKNESFRIRWSDTTTQTVSAAMTNGVTV